MPRLCWLITTTQTGYKAIRTHFICGCDLFADEIFQSLKKRSINSVDKSCLQTLAWMWTSACFIIHPRIALHESFPFRRDEWIRWKRFANCFYFSSLFFESHNEWVSSSAPRTVLTGSRFSDYSSSRGDCMIKAGRRIGAHKRYYSVIWRLTALSFYWVSIDLRRALVSLNVSFFTSVIGISSNNAVRSGLFLFQGALRVIRLRLSH